MSPDEQEVLELAERLAAFPEGGRIRDALVKLMKVDPVGALESARKMLHDLNELRN
jgi:hypothetical protein